MLNVFKNKSRERIFYDLSGAGGFLSIVFFSVSVSLSQFGLFLAVFGWILYSVSRKIKRTDASCPEMPFLFPRIMIPAAALYAVLLFSFLYHAFRSENYAKSILDTEIKDIFLTSAAFWVLAYASDPEGRKRVYKWLQYSFLTALTLGFISIFSKYRLAKIPYHLMHGWDASSLARLQHHAGTIFAGTPLEFHLYVPIGLMNTHLTYAFILSMLILPHIFLSLHRFITSERIVWKNTLMDFFPIAAAAAVLFLNNGRSAIFGFAAVLITGIYYYTRTIWKKRILKIAYPVLVFAAIVFLAAFITPRFGERFQHLTDSLTGKSKTTDYQRTLLWQAALDISQDFPILGAGPGNFQTEVEKRTLAYSIDQPDLWYAYSVIQRGHAHNDLLHLQTIGGFFAVFFFAFFIFMTAQSIFSGRASFSEHRWLWSALVMFPAGLYQCYFQDDESLLPFWIFMGLLMLDTSDKKGKGDVGEAEKN